MNAQIHLASDDSQVSLGLVTLVVGAPVVALLVILLIAFLRRGDSSDEPERVSGEAN